MKRELSLRVNLYGNKISMTDLQNITVNLAEPIAEEVRCDVEQFQHVTSSKVCVVECAIEKRAS